MSLAWKTIHHHMLELIIHQHTSVSEDVNLNAAQRPAAAADDGECRTGLDSTRPRSRYWSERLLMHQIQEQAEPVVVGFNANNNRPSGVRGFGLPEVTSS